MHTHPRGYSKYAVLKNKIIKKNETDLFRLLFCHSNYPRTILNQ